MAIDKTLIDQLLKDYKRPEEIIGENGLLKRLTKAVLERALEAEMSEHLGYAKHDPAGHHQGNPRNGKSRKTLKGEFGELELETPRDRQASFEPKIVGKRQTRWTGFDDKIISMYARGMTTREIQGHLEEIYGIEVSPALISNVTEAVIEEVKQWQSRPLEELHRASGASFAELCALETAQAGGRGSAFDLSCRHGGRSGTASGGVGGEVESLPQREPDMAAELDADPTVLQLSGGHSQGDLYHQQRGIAEPIASQNHQNPRRISQRRSSFEVAISGAATGGEEMDHADSSLARSLESLYDSVAGSDAGSRASGIMKPQNPSTSLGEGRGAAPSLAHPSPKPKTKTAAFTKVLTHLQHALAELGHHNAS